MCAAVHSSASATAYALPVPRIAPRHLLSDPLRVPRRSVAPQDYAQNGRLSTRSHQVLRIASCMLESSHVAGPQMRAYVDTATPCPPSPRTTLVLGSRNSFSRQQIRGGARRPAPERSRARRTSLGRAPILRDKRHCRCSYPHAPQCRPTLAFPPCLTPPRV